eukprot:GDKK01025896.1.p1 GENE.GDKK01025896.1~~GDKK01025896.1.p1  ORF type:complete len:102 (+),score=16.35 GDKK01025896.1:222-527(+)
MEEEEAAGAASLAESPSIEPLSAQLSSTAPLVAHVDPSVGAKPQSPILSPATYTSSGEQAALAHSRCNSSDSSSAIPSRLKRDSDDDRDDDFEQSSDASDF